MALILVRGENNSKILNAITDIEKHADLNITSKPKKINGEYADKIVEEILQANIKNASKVATAFSIAEDPTFAISKVRTIHPPAHIVVVSDEYDVYSDLLAILNDSPALEGYHSLKARSTKTKDYKELKQKKDKELDKNKNIYL